MIWSTEHFESIIGCQTLRPPRPLSWRSIFDSVPLYEVENPNWTLQIIFITSTSDTQTFLIRQLSLFEQSHPFWLLASIMPSMYTNTHGHLQHCIIFIEIDVSKFLWVSDWWSNVTKTCCWDSVEATKAHLLAFHNPRHAEYSFYNLHNVSIQWPLLMRGKRSIILCMEHNTIRVEGANGSSPRLSPCLHLSLLRKTIPQ